MQARGARVRARTTVLKTMHVHVGAPDRRTSAAGSHYRQPSSAPAHSNHTPAPQQLMLPRPSARPPKQSPAPPSTPPRQSPAPPHTLPAQSVSELRQPPQSRPPRKSEQPAIVPLQQSPQVWKHEPRPPQMPEPQPPKKELMASPHSHDAQPPTQPLMPWPTSLNACPHAPHTSVQPSPQLPKHRSSAPSCPSQHDPHASPQHPKSPSPPKSPPASPPKLSMMPLPDDSATSPKATAAAADAPSSTMPAPTASAVPDGALLRFFGAPLSSFASSSLISSAVVG
mmetsp:Transcript_10980/g.38220  ORF Transcript_10980/g.38220 Transcript_10980/m.38220 type:complete len:283 (+) Transcript_10980:1876-2724(+)